jgi:hypothetical protein
MELDQREEIREGDLTRTVEQQTAKIPSINWLGLAVGSMAISFVTSIVFGRRALGNFFGLWVPSLMLIGVYNKIVKLQADVERSLLH